MRLSRKSVCSRATWSWRSPSARRSSISRRSDASWSSCAAPVCRAAGGAVEDEGPMGISLEGNLLAVAAVGVLAGVVAIALAVLSVGVVRRSLRRLAASLEDLRRHPLVGVVPPEGDPLLG